MSLNIYPRLSEKTYTAAEQLNVYVFEVPIKLNKTQIKQLVETEYQVTVTKVRSLNQTGKPARSIRIKSRARARAGKRSDFKKAYVSLKQGDELPIFADQPKDQQAPSGR